MSIQKQFVKSKKLWKVTFHLPVAAAPDAAEVAILGDFNNWEFDRGIPMKFKNGVYAATVDLEPGKEYQFRYLIDNEFWENDWEADKYVPGPYGTENSVVVTPLPE